MPPMSTRQTERIHPFRENGARIKAARKQTEMSQERFAAEIGTTRRHMIRLENGEHLPSADLRNRIATATGQPAEMFEAADEESEDELLAPLARVIQDMVDRATRAALGQARA